MGGRSGGGRVALPILASTFFLQPLLAARYKLIKGRLYQLQMLCLLLFIGVSGHLNGWQIGRWTCGSSDLGFNLLPSTTSCRALQVDQGSTVPIADALPAAFHRSVGAPQWVADREVDVWLFRSWLQPSSFNHFLPRATS